MLARLWEYCKRDESIKNQEWDRLIEGTLTRPGEGSEEDEGEQVAEEVAERALEHSW